MPKKRKHKRAAKEEKTKPSLIAQHKERVRRVAELVNAGLPPRTW